MVSAIETEQLRLSQKRLEEIVGKEDRSDPPPAHFASRTAMVRLRAYRYRKKLHLWNELDRDLTSGEGKCVMHSGRRRNGSAIHGDVDLSTLFIAAMDRQATPSPAVFTSESERVYILRRRHAAGQHLYHADDRDEREVM
jgi:hypothetical protein